MSTRRTAESGGRLGRLPFAGRGNGLDADWWAPVLDVSAPVAAHLLDALTAAGIPGYTAPARTGRRGTWRLWVGSRHYAAAERVLLREMPGILADDPGALR